VSRVRQRFVAEGLEGALKERPRPGQRRKLSGPQEAHLVALACTKAPAGHTHWTLQLLGDKVVELELADAISLETVRQILKKTNLNRGRRSNGASQR
jgi:transposase